MERLGQSKEKSDWKSTLLKTGAVSTAIGVVLNSALFLGIGLGALGGSWYLNRQEKKK